MSYNNLMRVTSKYICLLFIVSFLCPFRFFLNLENWQIFPIPQVKSTLKFLHAIKAFPNFFLFSLKNNLTTRQKKQES